jgi:hypothetical protein
MKYVVSQGYQQQAEEEISTLDVRFRCGRCNTTTKNRSHGQTGSTSSQHSFNPADLVGCKGCANHALVAACTLCQLPLRSGGVFCALCGHGGHPNCMRSWFHVQDECPTGCGCQCVSSENNSSSDVHAHGHATSGHFVGNATGDGGTSQQQSTQFAGMKGSELQDEDSQNDEDEDEYSDDIGSDSDESVDNDDYDGEEDRGYRMDAVSADSDDPPSTRGARRRSVSQPEIPQGEYDSDNDSVEIPDPFDMHDV